MRRYENLINGQRYIMDNHTKIIHDLDNEKRECQIDEILKAFKDYSLNTFVDAEIKNKPLIHAYTPYNYLKAALAKGGNPCPFCFNKEKIE